MPERGRFSRTVPASDLAPLPTAEAAESAVSAAAAPYCLAVSAAALAASPALFLSSVAVWPKLLPLFVVGFAIVEPPQVIRSCVPGPGPHTGPPGSSGL